MPDTTKTSAGKRRLPRDTRVDALRGLALLMIFIDHVPGNLLSLVTLRNFGFSDAAELFVLLSGFSSMIAYGGSFDRDGAVAGLRRVLLRCVRLYVFQALLLLVVLALVGAWFRYFGLEPSPSALYVRSGLRGLQHSLTLQAQPSAMNILPLYIVLLALFPLIYGLIRISPLLALATSGALWVWVNFDRSINLTNWLDGQGWFFDPFAWGSSCSSSARWARCCCAGTTATCRVLSGCARRPGAISASRCLRRRRGRPGAGSTCTRSPSMRRTRPCWRRCGW